MDFDTFWARWPNKIAKKDALKSWDRAIARGADPKEIIEGRDRYVENKPDWKAWMHATTFLNGDRWEDVYDEPVDEFKYMTFEQRREWSRKHAPKLEENKLRIVR